MDDFLQRFSASDMVVRISEIVRDPTSNLVAALLLLAVVAIVLLFVLLIVAMFILNASDEDEDEDEYDDEDESDEAKAARHAAAAAAAAAIAAQAELEAQAEAQAEPKKPWPIRAGIFVGWSLLVFVLVWVAAGVTTAQTSACVSCHTDNPHKRTTDGDPHQSTACFRCHESGGILGAVTYTVPSRTAHYIAGILDRAAMGPYGATVSSSGCTNCHETVLKSTVTVEPQGIRISHKEPLEAGAECVDCHAMNSGVVSNQTVGMAPCLRCHDGAKVKSECDVCHTKDPGASIRTAEALADRSRDRIGQPDCGGCHDQKSCDACHGVRLPHTTEFMAWSHAREGVEDLWNNGGKTCGKCHTATRRPCTQCHTGVFPNHPLPSFKTNHGLGGPNNNACICHEAKRYIVGRNMCGLCHPEYVNVPSQ